MGRVLAWTLVLASLANSAASAVDTDGVPAPRCYKKVSVEAKYDYSRRLVRKARLVHDENDKGQITMTHYPAIYIEEKTLVTPAYVLLREVKCTKRVLRRAEPLPSSTCVQTRGCEELEPAAAD
ncbi:MAG: hypothetical protein ACU0CC_03995 [Sagittula sp.]|uniref:hypothetical protein n=1 Tax=Sagittula sp. TaxID=2038081 RepID=UPI0040599DD5